MNGLLEEVHQNEEMIAHQQRLQIMGTMTGGIAHEFNNFLTPIMGYAELLLMEFPEDSDEYDSVREIYEAAEKAKDVPSLAKHASKEANPLYPVPVLWNAKELAPLYRQIKGE